ncbi:MAG: hypothetical protein J7578_19600 [Chitinophagaceae bacterium]|nr:hypothetical protein [Chitinophagaceae bacterium]
MQVSLRAQKYIASLRRDPNYTASAEEHADYLIKIGLPVFIRVVEIGAKYGGLTLTIAKDQDNSFEADLFPRQHMLYGKPADEMVIDGFTWFFFGTHATAQYWYVLSETGVLAVYNNDTEKTCPIYTSFEKMIEGYAIEDELRKPLFNAYKAQSFGKGPNKSEIEKKWKTCKTFPEACDTYNSWYQMDSVLIQTGRVYDSDDYWTRVFSKKESDCQQILEELKAMS